MYSNSSMNSDFDSCLHEHHGIQTKRSRLSLDSGFGNDSLCSTDLNNSQLSDYSFGYECSSSVNEVESVNSSDSPPTKWPRITTPPNRKLLLNNVMTKKTDSTIFSPPTSHQSSSMLMVRTPKSLRMIGKISSSPALICSPLKESNSDNISGNRGFRKNTTLNNGLGVSKRCLVPSSESTPTKLETPSKNILSEEDVSFQGFNVLPILTPTKMNTFFNDDEDISHSINPSTSHNDCCKLNDDENFGSLMFPKGIPYKDESDKKVHLNVTEKLIQKVRNDENAIPKKSIFSKIVQLMSRSIEMEVYALQETMCCWRVGIDEYIEMKNRSKLRKKSLNDEAELSRFAQIGLEPFITPEKEFPLYSTHWTALATGRSRAQRELVSDAMNYMRNIRGMEPLRAPMSIESRFVDPPKITRLNLFKNHFSRSKK